MTFGEISPEFSVDNDVVYYEPEGESLEWSLQEELGIDVSLASDLAARLIDRDLAWPPDGDDPFFSDEESYQRRDVHPSEFIEAWEEFSQRIKREQRFFDPSAHDRLSAILGAPGSPEFTELPVTELKADDPSVRVFRARRADSIDQLKEYRAKLHIELARPPARKARAGRMNPEGIAVFYGALSRATAVAEVRPPLAAAVITASFALARDLRLLDLAKLGGGTTGSIFAPDYERRAARLQFLASFHTLISRPVLPFDESFEYLPTQAVAEFVANVLGFDGIVYASSQVGRLSEHEGQLIADDDELNIVLFHGAGSVVPPMGAVYADGKQADGPGEQNWSGGALILVEAETEAIRVEAIRYEMDKIYDFQYDPNVESPF